ncbi:Alpha/Beta hydrolase protein [Parachaetomium inaequale]|uniref:Alpha/Beta hydrolase protein n=1 Tax=Parachaetomium inaequale TaxID=2588326 RepID=A0AAN6SW83_9PEZI|nr:Alpha/Beta hydrolase protein [Parachaetomium inaequale]
MGSMFDSQPSLIQGGDDGNPNNNDTHNNSNATPLILIHDGGGTIFSYYCLGNLAPPARAVYGIANPRYESGTAWAGGLPEMARAYQEFIKAAIPRGGDVIIGGWSLGGLIALEIAGQLEAEAAAEKEEKKSVNLIGIVMVDSVCPVVVPGQPAVPVVQHAVQWSKHTKQETKDKVTRCFTEARRMAGEWELPRVWGSPEEDGEGKDGVAASSTAAKRPPPVVLLRATEPVPVPEGSDGVSRVDVHRSDRLLGWGNYRKDLITKVIDIPGHHFSIFHTEATLESTTEGIKRACLEIEAMDSGRLFA